MCRFQCGGLIVDHDQHGDSVDSVMVWMLHRLDIGISTDETTAVRFIEAIEYLVRG
jgi:hypothetical protein